MPPDPAPHVLVVDDDRAVRESLDRALRLQGMTVATAEHGLAALDALQRDAAVDVVVLDVNMPGVDGFGVARRMRADGDERPVLMLTAKDAVADRVAGLDAGADDYLVKPFALEELLARLRALLRRTVRDAEPDAPAVLRMDDVTLDVDQHRATRGERDLGLTRTEFLLLELLLENPRRVLPRDVIHDRVWGLDGATSSNALEVYVGYLRRKLEADGEPRVLHTVRGVGYVLRPAD